jgi:hypothetical protein
MGTRSAIGYQLPSGRIRAVYCHWDGYPKHQVPILIEHYNSLEKVKALIKPGSMSSLRTRDTWKTYADSMLRDENNEVIRDAEGYFCKEGDRGPQPLYHWERGDDGPWNATGSDYGDPPITKATLKSAKKYWLNSSCEYMYVFIPDLGWNHHPL